MTSFALSPVVDFLCENGFPQSTNHVVTAEIGHVLSTNSTNNNTTPLYCQGISKDKFNAWFKYIIQFSGWSSKSSCWHAFRLYEMNDIICTEQKQFPYITYAKIGEMVYSPVLLAAPEEPFGIKMTCHKIDVPSKTDPSLVELSKQVSMKGSVLSQTIGKRYILQHSGVEWSFVMQQTGTSLTNAVNQPRKYIISLSSNILDIRKESFTYQLSNLLEKVRDFFVRPDEVLMPKVFFILSVTNPNIHSLCLHR
jgi:hypothetical protein